MPKTLYTWKYTYDANGNIIMVEEYRNGSLLHTISYEYDSRGQLVFEEKLQGTAFDRYYYEYDEIGNLLTCGYEYGDYADFGLSPRTNQHFFYGAYTPAHWDRLGHQMEGWCQGTGDEYTFSSPTNTITYDALYNPLTYSNPAGKSFTFTWSGRRLTGVNSNISYTYNEDGIRTSKTVDGITYTYILNGSTILAELWTKNGKDYAIYYTYDETGLPFSMEYTNGEESAILYYITNPMGDVVALCAENGNIVASYTYSAWGSQTEHYSYSSTSIQRLTAELNPFRYRSYYYDTETGFYYCNSRYYDPSVYRWINPDAFVSTGQSVLGYNMFVYCGNNPINRSDASGEFWGVAILIVVAIGIALLPGCTSSPQKPRSDLANAPDLDINTADSGTYNCYGNAIGKQIVTDPTGYKQGDSTRETFDAVKKDLGKGNVRELSSINDPIGDDEVKVAIKCGPTDYHFIRLDGDQWYNKSGIMPGAYIDQSIVEQDVWFPIWTKGGQKHIGLPQYGFPYYNDETIYFAIKIGWATP